MLRLALRQTAAKIPENIDWDAFCQTMDKHRVYPLVIRGIRQLPADVVERYPVLKSYRARQNSYAMESLKQMKALSQIAGAFADAGIRMLSMKGPLLSVELYGDPAMRSSHDLDVLVSENDYFAACQCLKSMGYERRENIYESTYLRSRLTLLYSEDKHTEFRKDGVCIELHWRGSIWYKSNLEDLWENRETKMLLGKPIHQMGRIDEWPYLISHAAVHGYMRLRWLMDLYELQKKPEFSWSKIYSQMRENGNAAVLLETLIVMFRLGVLPMEEIRTDLFRIGREDGSVVLHYSGEIREDVEDAVRFAEAAYPIMMVDRKMGSDDWHAYRSMLPMEEAKQSLLVRIVNIFRPVDVDYELIDLPDSLFWLYFIIRPVYWLWRKLFGGKQ